MTSNNRDLFSQSLGATCPKSRFPRGWFFLKTRRQNDSVRLSCLLEAAGNACISCLVDGSLQSLTLSFHGLFPVSVYFLLSLSFLIGHWSLDLGPTQIIQSQSHLISKSLITSAKTLFPNKTIIIASRWTYFLEGLPFNPPQVRYIFWLVKSLMLVWHK